MIVKRISVELDRNHIDRLSNERGDMNTFSEVIMVLPRPGGKILTLTKSFYPDSIFNLPSGGIHPGESPEEAFAREVVEETSLPVMIESHIGRIEHHCYYKDQSLDFTSHVILGAESSQTPHPADEEECISAYFDAGVDDLRRFTANMRALTGRWLGFGRFRATALKFISEYLANLPAHTS